MIDRPKMRELEMHPIDDSGRDGALLSDPDGLFETPVFIPRGLFPVLARFDGELSCEEIAEDLRREFGQEVSTEQVAGIAADLARRHCLETIETARAIDERHRDFAELRCRPLRHAGSAGYPSEATACASRLDEILAMREAQVDSLDERLVGLVSPHIDLARGEKGYAAAYGALRATGVEQAELVVLFGTAHQGPRSMLVPTRKDFETPWGVVETDRELVSAVEDALPSRVLPREERMHIHEHSLEFQVLFLRHVFGDRPLRIAPFLTGHLHDAEARAHAQRLADVIHDAAGRSSKRVLYLAGADFAHEGPFFGDDAPVSDARLAELCDEDAESLEALAARGEDEFHRGVEGAGNPRRICGTTPCYFVRALSARAGATHGEVLHYGQALADDRSQVVSFAAMRFAAS